MQYSNIFYARQPVYDQEIFCYIMVMKDIMSELVTELIVRYGQFKPICKYDKYDYATHFDNNDYVSFLLYIPAPFKEYCERVDVWIAEARLYCDIDKYQYKIKYDHFNGIYEDLGWNEFPDLKSLISAMDYERQEFVKAHSMQFENAATSMAIEGLK